MGGGDEKNNIIPLTAKAHYVAHHLLHKAYPENKKLANAFGMMLCSGDHQQRRFTPRMYDNARIALSKARKGSKNPALAERNRLNRKHPPPIKKQRTPNREAFKVYNELKKINGFTAEEIEQKRKAGRARKGVPMSEEGRLNCVAAAKERYRVAAAITCSVCGHTQKRSANFYKYHDKNCKL